MRGEWQEKLLALRLENLLGPRLVKVMENRGALADPDPDRPDHRRDRCSTAPAGSPTPIARWFAWADLAICSVLLAEFLLKLALAPRKGLYFLRHLVIDFLASLPFGFLSYQIEVAQLEAGLEHAGEALRLLRFLRFGRLIQMLRYVRLALPAVRLARVGLFLLRLSDRLVRQHAGLLNRNIVLFEPFHAQRPESGDHHRLSALRAEQEHAAAQLKVSPRPPPSAGGSRRRILADLDIRIETLPAEAFDGESEEFGGTRRS